MLLDIKERMQAVLQAEAAAIAAINITDDFERAVVVMQECGGKILTTGMGKAGLKRPFGRFRRRAGQPRRPADRGFE